MHRVPPRAAPLLLAAALALAAPAGAAADPAAACRALRRQRDQLARQAMEAEIQLVQATRRRLCPALEDAASAGEGLDMEAYIRCRALTEAQLKRTQVLLYTNRRGFVFYTREGARLAREADAGRFSAPAVRCAGQE